MARRAGPIFISLTIFALVNAAPLLDCDEEPTWRDQVRAAKLTIQSSGAKMVQFGPEQNKATWFDMKYQADKKGIMVERFGNGKSMHDSWLNVEALKVRQFNFRLYEIPAEGSDILFEGRKNAKSNRDRRTSSIGTGDGDTVKMACMTTHNYEAGDDDLGGYGFDSKISST